MTANSHLLALWNPAYATNAMERHLDTLLARIRQANAGEIDEDEVYVWWGKVRSEHREGDLPHLERICALDSDVDEREVHVYLTDYRSLFVAHLGKVSCEDPRSDPGEPVPDYYANIGDCDCWFQLWDIRRIVSDDTSEVVSQLRKLRDPSYHNRPVSIYGGMRDLPLIVTREDDVEFFDPDRRQHLTDGKHWAEFDAEHSGIGSIERELRENMLGDRAWAGLNPAARTFAASAEKVMRDHRADFAFDFSPVVVELCKTYEVQSNELLQKLARRIPQPRRYFNFDGRSRDVTTLGHLTLGELARVLSDPELTGAFMHWMNADDFKWFSGSLPVILKELADTRNAAAHSTRVDRDAALRIRERALGVGCEGELARLGKVRIT